MDISVDRENNLICVSAASLAAFARTRQQRSSKLSFEESFDDPGKPVSSGSELSYSVSGEDISFNVRGKAELLYFDGKQWTIEKFRERIRLTSRTRPVADAPFLAESVLCAYMLCCEKKLSSVKVRMTYFVRGKSEIKSFSCVFEEPFLRHMSEVLFSRAVPFIAIEAEKILCGKPALSKMAFPYREIRPGQRDFISDAYHAAKAGSRLLVCAPTGIGKTVSALYPALRAVGDGHIDKVFYLTAKTVTGNAAAEAVRAMSAQVQTLRCVTVIAKERTCRMAGDTPPGMSKCRSCPYLGEINRVPYEERRDEALLEILSSSRIIDTGTLSAAAQKYSLCPYELSLDASEWCECIICDYNYVFDPNIRFKRYFVEGHGNYMLLIDEAHNLADRAREMYSAEIKAADFLRLYKTAKDDFPANTPLIEGLKAFVIKLRGISELCRSEEHMDQSNTSVGFYLSSSVPDGFADALNQFMRAAVTASRADEKAAAKLERVISDSFALSRSFSLFDSRFAFYAEQQGGRLKIASRCLDPSAMLNNMMCAAKSTVLFSATLTPMDYFADVLGCTDAARLELASPYDPARLCLFAVDSVSTRYSEREAFCDDIAEIISSVAEAKDGNYIVYFPSYEYLESVYKAFCEMSPETRTIVQKRGMSYNDRNRFLAAFSEHGDETLIGFCVLGGAFSEGVDLRGEKLIGTVIVGTGLPKITAEQNILRDYFEKTRENGTDYAYTFPAMIKVQQAAGRVIRSEKDRGVVVLVDDRYGEPATYRLFPKYWHHIKFTGDPYSLNTALADFWAKEN